MKPYMKLSTVNVYALKDVANIKSMVQLTKWLQPLQSEFAYLVREHHRINDDPLRDCYIVYANGRIALFVNDITEGAFEKLNEDDDDED